MDPLERLDVRQSGRSVLAPEGRRPPRRTWCLATHPYAGAVETVALVPCAASPASARTNEAPPVGRAVPPPIPTSDPTSRPPRGRQRCLLLGSAAGVTGLVAAPVTDLHVGGSAAATQPERWRGWRGASGSCPLDRRGQRAAVLAVVAMTGGTGLPGVPGVVTPLWMVVAFTGMALGRSTIAR